MNELQIIERDFEPLLPQLRQALAHTMPVERLVRSILISCERTPKLLQADRQSLFNAGMTGAMLGLEADGVTGQLFFIPFDDKKNKRTVVQPVIGYKGFNTLGARSGLTIAGGVVREGDEFDFAEGTKPFVHHKRCADPGRIIWAWSTATSIARPPSVKVLSIADVEAIKAKSPRGKQPPWGDPEIGFPAMAEKSAKRRLARDMPLNVFQQAARMEEAFEEQGKHAWIGPQGVTVEGQVLPSRHNTETPSANDLINPPSLEEEASMSAERGKDAFRAYCARLTKTQYVTIVKPKLAEFEEIARRADEQSTQAE